MSSLDFRKYEPTNSFSSSFWQATGESGMHYRIVLADSKYTLFEFTRTEANGITPLFSIKIAEFRNLKRAEERAIHNENLRMKMRGAVRIPYSD